MIKNITPCKKCDWYSEPVEEGKEGWCFSILNRPVEEDDYCSFGIPRQSKERDN